jgi:SulP family sulfate permease
MSDLLGTGGITREEDRAERVVWKGFGAMEVLRNQKMAFLRRHVPIVEWLPRYRWREHAVGDVLGGLTMAILLLGEGIAYALLAGIPAEVGIYSALIPTFVYSVLGTSRHLSVGAISLTAVMTGVVVLDNGTGNPAEDAALAHALCLSVGFFLVLFGVLRMAFIEHVLSLPIREGFISGMALTIISGQLMGLLGIPKGNLHSHTIWENLRFFFAHIGAANRVDVAIGLLCLLVQALIKALRKTRRFAFLAFVPGVLVVTVIATVVSFSCKLHARYGISVLGYVPAGFPVPGAPTAWSPAFFQASLAPALIIAFVGFIEALAVEREMAAVHQYPISANSELVALGAANLAGSFFRAMPALGSIGRSLAGNASGARTQMAGLVASLFMVVLCFASSLLYHLPRSAVSSIIVVVISSLVDFMTIPAMWRSRLFMDLAFFTTAFALTFALGIEQGIILSAVVSALYVIRRGTIPTPSFLGRVVGTTIYKPLAARSGDAKPIDNVVILQPGTPLFYFINASHLKKCVLRVLDGRGPSGLPAPAWLLSGETAGLVIDLSDVEAVDFTAVEVLTEISKSAGRAGVAFGVTGVRGALKKVFRECRHLRSSIKPRYYCGDLHTVVIEMETSLVTEPILLTTRLSIRTKQELTQQGTVMPFDDEGDSDQDRWNDTMAPHEFDAFAASAL